jgi:hypothetical protein
VKILLIIAGIVLLPPGLCTIAYFAQLPKIAFELWVYPFAVSANGIFLFVIGIILQ